MMEWWNSWCDVGAIWLACALVLAVARLTERKSSGGGATFPPAPSPVFCICADPDLDSVGQCGACFRKPRSAMSL